MSEPSMPEIKRFHPLQGAASNTVTGPDLVMEVSPECAKFNLRMDLEHLGDAAAAFGMELPDKVGLMLWEAEKLALCLGPDEWLLVTPEATSLEIVSRFFALEKNSPHSLVDVSDRTVGIDLTGPLATRALNAGCPLDLENMPVCRCTRTVLEKAEIVLIKLEKQKYRLEIARSFAPYVWDFVHKAGISARQMPAEQGS